MGEPELHRQRAIDFFNRCWELLAEPKSGDRDEALLESAWASYREWSVVGGPQEWTVGEWMLARCAGEAGYGALAIDAAIRGHERARSFDAPDWLLASTSEGVARAFSDAGDHVRADEWATRAASEIEALTDDDDRVLLRGQLTDTRCRMVERESHTA